MWILKRELPAIDRFRDLNALLNAFMHIWNYRSKTPVSTVSFQIGEGIQMRGFFRISMKQRFCQFFEFLPGLFLQISVFIQISGQIGRKNIPFFIIIFYSSWQRIRQYNPVPLNFPSVRFLRRTESEEFSLNPSKVFLEGWVRLWKRQRVFQIVFEFLFFDDIEWTECRLKVQWSSVSIS